MYRLEGKDIVIDGFEQGIADTPYEGIGDMRNIDVISMPKEAMVNFKEVSATLPPIITAKSFVADPTTDRLTWDGSIAGLYEGAAISLDTSVGTTATVLVVGGGGGGGGGVIFGSSGGGGGAGEYIASTQAFTTGSYTITVGAAGASGAVDTNGGSGGTSSIAALKVAVGGGGGGKSVTSGVNGGSGGGGGGMGGVGATVGGTTTAASGLGNDGGGAGPQEGGGGGGGSAAVGTTVTGTAGGAGGAGTSNSISGGAVTYAAGGAGGGAGTGNGASASANTGNGGIGGGANANTTGGAGGSGIVIISYPTTSMTATGGTITTSGSNTIHTFTTGGTFTVSGGLTDDIVYYVRNIVGSTFQLSLSFQGAIVDFAGITTGTFTTYQYGEQRGVGPGQQQGYFVDTTGGAFNGNSSVLLIDSSNYAWVISPAASDSLAANTLYFLGNIGGIGATSRRSTVGFWKDYIFVFGGGSSDTIDYASASDLYSNGPAATWSYAWSDEDVSQFFPRVLVSQEDDNFYFTSRLGLGSIVEQPGQIFDPTDSNTYEITDTAIQLPTNDNPTCIAELGNDIYIGGVLKYIYVWNKISPGFSSFLTAPESNIQKLVATDQNIYAFIGNRGRIYITNGAAIDIFKKIPDYITGTINPYIKWQDASSSRNQLYCSFTATDNSNNALTTVAGAWAVDIDTKALRMVNKITNSGYAGITTMVVEMPRATYESFTQPVGTGLLLGWNVSSTYGVDIPSATPYTSLESYIDLDMIPVGTYLNSFSPSQIEWKTAIPLGANGTAETITLYYRKNLYDAFVQLGTTTATGTSVVGSTTGTTTISGISDYYVANFEKAQWIGLRIAMSSNATTPTYNRLTEVRIRDFTQ